MDPQRSTKNIKNELDILLRERTDLTKHKNLNKLSTKVKLSLEGYNVLIQVLEMELAKSKLSKKGPKPVEKSNQADTPEREI